jgi:hypothetical protein
MYHAAYFQNLIRSPKFFPRFPISHIRIRFRLLTVEPEGHYSEQMRNIIMAMYTD